MRSILIKNILLIICFLSILSSCMDQTLSDYSMDVPGRVRWENVPVSGKSQNRLFHSEEMDRVFADFYTSLGKRISFNGETGLTPSSFRIGVKAAPIIAPNLETDLLFLAHQRPEDPSTYHIDFMDPEYNINLCTVSNGPYSGFALGFATVNELHTNQYMDDFVLFTPAVLVEIPGYTEFSDVISADFQNPEDNPVDGTVLYERKRISGNIFQFTPGFLMPNYMVDEGNITLHRPYVEFQVDTMDYDVSPGRILPVESYVFSSNVASPIAHISGYPGEETDTVPQTEFHSELDYFSGFGLLELPGENFRLEAIDYKYTAQVLPAIITIGMDMENLIEVYDNGTENIIFDDIVVLANGWWNRFSFSVAYAESP